MAVLATLSLATPTVGLIGSNGALRFDESTIRARLAALPPAARADFGLGDTLSVFGSIIAGPAALQRFAGDADLNSDDRPIVAYRAPRLTYVPDSTPGERLTQLVRELGAVPDDAPAPTDPEWARRVAAYRQARDAYLLAGVKVTPSSDPRVMLDQVEAPLREVLRISPDFEPAYDPLFAMAVALAPDDRVRAMSLLEMLSRVRPDRPEALAALQRLEAPTRGGPAPP
jgi:spermidine synthase